MSKDAKPLALSETLRDLALLRVSDLDVASLVPPQATQSSKPETTTNATVEQSYEFVRQARAAIKLYNRGEVEQVGSGVEAIRMKVEELSDGLHDTR
ncbi:hypothetical protein MVEN_00551400 [Mycena venus]|uniref:Uncharacterized protein n=1 Tax=Mycena venus TaxID=2733690 RepID=A0A8H6YQG1_9AGAR|nr:hypothetical protein MVEN_00551400 [Mycena venus]